MPCSFELRYQPLSADQPALSFPCDAGGHVALDSLSDRERDDYLFARAVVGHDFARPVVQGTRADALPAISQDRLRAQTRMITSSLRRSLTWLRRHAELHP